MRTFFIATILLLCTTAGHAQDFNWMAKLMQQPVDSVIRSRNYLYNNGPFRSYLQSAWATKEGGYVLEYANVVDDNYSYDIFFFDKHSRCTELKTVMKIENLGEQLQTLSNSFIKVNDRTLYHKNLNLKVTYYSNLSDKSAVFIYTRKETIVPLN